MTDSVCSRCGSGQQVERPRLALCEITNRDENDLEVPDSSKLALWSIALCESCIDESVANIISGRASDSFQLMVAGPAIAWFGLGWLFVGPSIMADSAGNDLAGMAGALMFFAGVIALPVGLIVGPLATRSFFKWRRVAREGDDMTESFQESAFFREACRISSQLVDKMHSEADETREPAADKSQMFGDFKLPDPVSLERIHAKIIAVEPTQDRLNAALASLPEGRAHDLRTKLLRLKEQHD